MIKKSAISLLFLLLTIYCKGQNNDFFNQNTVSYFPTTLSNNKNTIYIQSNQTPIGFNNIQIQLNQSINKRFDIGYIIQNQNNHLLSQNKLSLPVSYNFKNKLFLGSLISFTNAKDKITTLTINNGIGALIATGGYQNKKIKIHGSYHLISKEFNPLYQWAVGSSILFFQKKNIAFSYDMLTSGTINLPINTHHILNIKLKDKLQLQTGINQHIDPSIGIGYQYKQINKIISRINHLTLFYGIKVDKIAREYIEQQFTISCQIGNHPRLSKINKKPIERLPIYVY